MKTAFDAKKIVRNRTGIGNYSRRILWALNQRQEVTDMLLLAPRGGDPTLLSSLPPKSSVVTPPAMLPGGVGFELWRASRSAAIANANGVDIYHGVSNELPADIARFRGAKVVTIHDLIFLKLPETYPASMRRILEKKTRFACRHADRIIAVSERTRRDIIELYGVDPERIKVVYQSIDPLFFESAEPQMPADARALQPYILCVGTVEQRKNQQILIEALPSLPDELRLVIIGKSTPYADRLRARAEELGVASRVDFLHSIPNAQLPGWYHNAMVTCNPSRYEGFGIPVAEALASGSPVVAATGSCLEEAGGSDSLYADPDDAGQWVDAINRVYTDAGLRSRMIDAGHRYANNFRDTTMGDRLMALYQSLIK